MICSLKGCKRQQLHRDYLPEDMDDYLESVKLGDSNSQRIKFPLSCLISLSPNAKLYYAGHPIKGIRRESQENQIPLTMLRYQAGDAVIFRNIEHHGAEYSNTSLHFRFFSQSIFSLSRG